MLSELRGVALVDDPHLGHHLGVWRPIPLAWATATEIPPLRTLDEIKSSREGYFFSDRYRDAWEPALTNLIQARFQAQADEVEPDRGGRRHIVVKEPGSQAAGLLMDLFPDSRLVFLLRDGRDVIDSWLDAYAEGSWAIDEGAYPVADHGRVALVEWLAAVWVTRTRIVRECFLACDPDRRAMVRYEQMREDPVGSLKAIGEVIGLEPTEAELARAVEQHRFEKARPDERGEGKAIRKARPGSWQQGLNEDEVRAAMKIMGPTLMELGYETESRSAPLAT